MFIPLLIIQVITFIALVLLLRVLFYNNLKTSLNRLSDLHEQNVVKEDQLKEELERARAERLAEVERGKAEAKEIIENAKKEADSLKAKAADDSKTEGQDITLRAQQDAEKFKQNILAELGKQALGLSMQMIQFTFSSKGKENLQQQLIDEVISEISALSKDKFTVVTDKVKVASAFPLNEVERQNLKNTLSEKLNSPVVLEERIEADLVAGLIIEIGALIIDGTLKNSLSRALVYLKHDRSWW